MAGALRVATRGSSLARWQANRVVSLLDTEAELVIVSTTGDQRSDTPLHQLGGVGVFVKEVSDAVLEGRADCAVHSAKDLPSETAEGLVLAAVPERADPRDALVGCTLAELPAGAVVATGSVRRRAQLAALRDDLLFAELRGNLDTRLEKAAGFDAIVVAMAALIRLGETAWAAEVLDPELMLPQVGQGALAIECRADDASTRSILRGIDDPIVHGALIAERAFLAQIGGGCDQPVGAYATVEADGTVTIDALIASIDGRVVVRSQVIGDDALSVGREAATQLLDHHGGRALLEDAR